MMNWLMANSATIIVSAVLVLVVGLIIFKMIKDKKEGKSSCNCGCSCGGCALEGKCHSTDNTKK